MEAKGAFLLQMIPFNPLQPLVLYSLQYRPAYTATGERRSPHLCKRLGLKDGDILIWELNGDREARICKAKIEKDLVRF